LGNRFVAILFIFTFLLAGCGQPAPASPVPAPSTVAPAPAATVAPADTSTPVGSPTPAGLDLLISAAQQEGQLNVIALPHDWMNYGEIISVFSQKYGITVTEISPAASSGDEIRALQSAKVSRDASAPDVVDIGLTFAAQAKSENLLQPYKVLTWSTIPENAKDADAYWYGDYYGIIVFEINPKIVQDAPQDWSDLLRPGYKVALSGVPSQAFQAMISVYSAALANRGSLSDVLPGLRYFQQINRNGSLMNIVLPNGGYANGDTVASGETPIALRWDYLALAYQHAHPGVNQNLVVAPKTGNVAGLYAQGISAYAPHPNAAKLWMEFLYSDEGQLLLLKGWGHPVRFGDMVQRGVIPADALNGFLPAEIYMNAQFPTSEQISAADKSILASWRSYVP
jgi:putative spermidine/putrescine transport system substrate-binding protein